MGRFLETNRVNQHALWALLLCLGSPFYCTPLLAQDPANRSEVFGGFGWAGMENSSGFLSPTVQASGPHFVGGIGYRLYSWLGAEGSGNLIHYSETISDGSSIEGTVFSLSGNAVFHFLREMAQPYLLLGLGLLHFNGTRVRDNPLSGQVTISDNSEFDGSLNLGLGAKIFLKPRISLRPELRVFTNGKIFSGTNVLGGSIAVGYHW
jgi:hypothetical protein